MDFICEGITPWERDVGPSLPGKVYSVLVPLIFKETAESSEKNNRNDQGTGKKNKEKTKKGREIIWHTKKYKWEEKSGIKMGEI